MKFLPLRSSPAALTLLAFLTLSACTTPRQETTLYQRLGGQEGITTVVDNLLFEISEDEDVVPLFARTDIDRFREKLIEQLCDLSDGPCTYDGDTMGETHKDLAIRRSQFNSLVEDLIRAMEEAGVATADQNALLSRLVPLYPDIVTSPR